MTDQQFLAELAIRATRDQIEGYPLGHPKRVGFQPIVPRIERGDGLIDRIETLKFPCYWKFTGAQREALLDLSSSWPWPTCGGHEERSSMADPL